MAYVALLRGINVGGKAMVSMAQLKETFEGLGLKDVGTYINSGNVVFTGGEDRKKLRPRIERAIKADFGLDVAVVLRDTKEMKAVVDAIPRGWRNDTEQKSDVFFSDRFDSADSVELLPLTPKVEKVRWVPGAVICRIDRKVQSKSRLTKLVGTDLYKSMTARNVNTARKLYDLLRAVDE
jgi:uncharacterized protein (DUF1697 family)